jgi:P-type Cu+ transporter
MTTSLETTTLAVQGMTCSACVNSIERTLNSMEGVKASVNFGSETVHILAPAEINPKIFIQKIKEAGYSASPLGDSSHVSMHNKKSSIALFFAALFAIPAITISMTMSWHHAIDVWILDKLDLLGVLHPTYSPTAWLVIGLTTPVVLFVAWPIHRAALRNFFHPTMDNLVSLGSLSAFGWSIYANSTGAGDVYTEVAGGVILLVVLGRYLETRAKRRASSALSALLSLGAKEVTIIRGGLPLISSIENLQIGDEFEVRPGDRIATDGIVVSGSSAVDNSMLTGESALIDVTIGSTVIGASLNHNGRIVVRATRIGSDTELARITAMVVNAQSTKAPIQRLADRISAVFVPVVTLGAIATYFVWRYNGDSLTQSISVAITVLVIACPCALGLATPVALLVASGRGAQRGIVIREPRVLEVARTIDTVVLDKTGTLTAGVMKVQEATVVLEAGAILGNGFTELLKEATILSTALSIENQNNHPIAHAISAYVSAQSINTTTVSDFSITPGAGAAGRVNLGIQSPVVLIGSPQAVAHSSTSFHPKISRAISVAQSSGLTISVLAWDGVALAVFAVGDEIKSDASETVIALRAMGITPWLVTGDSPEVASSVASRVSIDSDHVVASAMPEDKLAVVEKLKQEGHRVLMIGDGINDAAALSAADLSMAMGTGTDTAISSADITLMRTTFSSVIDALELSKKTVRIIRTNLGWAFLYNVIGLPIAALGLLTPLYAAAAMAMSSLFVVTNSLRIK